MGLYDVTAPCSFMVDGNAVHHTHPAPAVEIDDAEAGPLVEAGCLTPAAQAVFTEPDPVPEEPVVDEPPQERSRRKPGHDEG